MLTSMFAIIVNNLFLRFLIILDNSPVTPFILIFLDASVLAFIKSLIDSASSKSLLPFKNALFRNSPGSANRQPCSNSISKILFVTAKPPWVFISTMFSPVYVFGSRKTETNTSSTFSSLSFM